MSIRRGQVTGRVAALPWEEIERQYVAGEPCSALAIEHGVASRTVARVLKSRGVTLRIGGRRTQLPVPNSDIRAAYSAGRTTRQLADQYGVSQAHISRLLRFRNGAERKAGEVRPVDPSPVQPASRKRLNLPAADVAAAYVAGQDIPQLAERYGCTRRGILAALRKARIETRAE